MARKRWKKDRGGKEEETPRTDDGKRKQTIVLIAALLIVMLIGYYLLGQTSTPPSTPSASRNIKGNYEFLSGKPNTHVPGRVVLVEFFDFYCSHCYTFHKDRWPALQEKYGDQIALLEYGYPLRQSSNPPIEAYEIAKELGRGEEMKDALFKAIHEEKKDISNTEALAGIAETVGLDKDTFTRALNTHVKASTVDENTRLGNSFGLEGTPTFIIDGNIKTTDSSVSNLEAIIDSILRGE